MLEILLSAENEHSELAHRETRLMKSTLDSGRSSSVVLFVTHFNASMATSTGTPVKSNVTLKLAILFFNGVLCSL